MTHRKIKDDDGRWWDVWEVYPAAVERRMSGEFPAVKQDGHPERDGRPSGERRREVRLLVPAELQHGWLAFQSGTDRRRVVPVPDNWSTLNDDALVRLLEGADRVSDGDGG
jgi:hypothetical protein